MIIRMNLEPGDHRTMSASQVLLNEPLQHSGILLVFSMDGIYTPNLQLHWCFQSQLILCRKTLLQNKNVQWISICQKVLSSHEMKHSEQGYFTNIVKTRWPQDSPRHLLKSNAFLKQNTHLLDSSFLQFRRPDTLWQNSNSWALWEGKVFQAIWASRFI